MYLISKEKKALTLIEVIIYLALFGMFFFVAIRFTLATSEFNREATERIQVDQASIFVTAHISDSIEKSASIDKINSVFLNNSGTLRLISPTSTYLNYAIVSNRLSVDNNGTTYFLTAPDVYVSKFYIEPVYKKDLVTVSGVKITIRLYDFHDASNFSEFTLSKVL